MSQILILSTEEKAAMAAAEARAREVYECGTAWYEFDHRTCDYTGRVVVGIDASDDYVVALGAGATWDEAFAAAELRCAPGLAQQLAESQAREKLLRAALEAYPEKPTKDESGLVVPFFRALPGFEKLRRFALLSPAARRYVEGVRAALVVRARNDGAHSPEEDALLDACDPLHDALEPADHDAVSAVLQADDYPSPPPPAPAEVPTGDRYLSPGAQAFENAVCQTCGKWHDLCEGHKPKPTGAA